MTRSELLAQTRRRMQAVDSPTQVLGRTQTIGCVAVEITQKCNLDCALCYLSEHSQSVKDIPLAEVYRRLDAVLEHYGTNTHVQITGGDPTLRKHTELVEIVAYARRIGLYPALFTNGIGATRPLLKRLADAGLSDIAFHVDTTQKRKGYSSERSLNGLRQTYIERARGLGLMVIFNTTIHAGNFAEIPELVRFFTHHADMIGLVSFNLQAGTGRGKWGSRSNLVSQFSVRAQVDAGTQTALPWGVVQIGHGDCHSYMPTLVVDGKAHAAFHDSQFFGDLLRDFGSVDADRHSSPAALVGRYLLALARRPRWWPRMLSYGFVLLKAMGGGLLRARGRVYKLTFFIQNFMDAENLDEDRLHACSFMVITADGPVPMCEHNAHRDDYILKPLDVPQPNGRVERYEPLVWTESNRREGNCIESHSAS